MSARRIVPSLLLSLALALGFASTMTVSGHAASPPKRVARVTIQTFSFSPATLKIKAGTTVIWTNKDDMAHTVTGTRGHWGSGSIASGRTYAYTFKKPGTYAYICAIHPAMSAKVVVQK